jgi:hypothetical protein
VIERVGRTNGSIDCLDCERMAMAVCSPVIYVGGRDDFMVPVEATQREFFELLGTPPDQKRHFRRPAMSRRS